MHRKETLDQFENFAHNVRWLRKKYGIPKKKMAQLLGIGVQSLNKVEKGVIPPRLSANIIIRIWEHFGILPKDQFGKRFYE